MGLDVYVGTLTRYYTHDWETIVQQTGRAQGIPVQMIRANPHETQNPAEVQKVVIGWQRDLEASLKHGQLTTSDLDWAEELDAPYFTDKPDWDGFGAMTLLAAYEEAPKSLFGGRFPKTLSERWQEDHKLAARLNTDRPPRYSHLYGCAAWIPAALNASFTGPMPAGKPIRIGSTTALLEQLELLNQRTYAGSSDDLVQWAKPADDDDSRFEPKAKFGLAIFLELTRLAVQHRLPMLLDY